MRDDGLAFASGDAGKVAVMLTNEQWMTSGYGAEPDAVVGLASWVAREWSYGATIVRMSGIVSYGVIGECKHSDGSRWFVVTDRYNTVFADGDTAQDAVDRFVADRDAAELARVRQIVADDDCVIDYVDAVTP